MLSPLRKESPLRKCGRVLWPVVMHFLIFQIAGNLILLLLMGLSGQEGVTIYNNNAIVITGVAGLCVLFPALYLYTRDQKRRMAGGLLPGVGENHLSLWDGVLLLILGAGAAHFFNMIVNILQIFIRSTTYQENMAQITEGKSLLMMIFWMGIIAPVSEEVVFRWLLYLRLRDYMKTGAATVISGVIFGIYHGNITQAIYASILGIVFAYVLEMTGNLLSSVLLHIGSNIWSLVISEAALQLTDPQALSILGMGILVLFILAGIIYAYFMKRGKRRKKRCV